MTDSNSIDGIRVSQARVIERKLRESNDDLEDDADVKFRVPEGSQTVPEGFGPDMEFNMSVESKQ
jgi:hypothetical protein